MRKLSYLFSGLSLALITWFGPACETTYIPVSGEVDFIQGSTKGTVILKILDAHMGTPVMNVMVTMAGVGSALSDSTGTVTFDSVKVGNYILDGVRVGYASVIASLAITIDQSSNTVPVIKQSADVLYMAQAGVSIRGTVFYQHLQNKLFAPNAVVECRFVDTAIHFKEPVRTTIALDGSFSFSDLPSYTTYSVSVLPYNDGTNNYKQGSTTTLTGQAVNDTLSVTPIVLQQVAPENFIILSHNLQTLTVGDSIKIDFSAPVDISTLTSDSISMLINTTQKMLIKTYWQAAGTRLVIVPFDGQWSIYESYRLTIKKLKSTTGKVLDNSTFVPYIFTPILSGALGNVQNLRYRVGTSDTNKVDYNTSSLNILWSKLANATTYELYTKATNDSGWYLLDSDIDTIIPVTTTGLFNNGMQVKYLVLGSNSTSSSALETALVITVKDNKRPVINFTSTSSGFNNSLVLLPDSVVIAISSTYIPEPMDTTKDPVVTVIEASYAVGATMYGDSTYAVSQAGCKWTWTSNRSGSLYVPIDSASNGAYDTLSLDFRTVTDIAGNMADTTNGAGFIKFQTRN